MFLLLRIKKSINKNTKQQSSKVGKELKDKLNKIVSIQETLEYRLVFNHKNSYFHLTENLELDNSSIMVKIAKGFKEIFYSNIETKQRVRYTESTGKGFNILTERDLNWKITKQTKNIDGFLCYKATSYFRDVNPKTNEIKEFSPYVWFTPSIPVPYGPIGLDGLPGLVLEASLNGNTIYSAIKIEIDKYSEKELIVKIPEGEIITESEYFEIMKKAFENKN